MIYKISNDELARVVFGTVPQLFQFYILAGWLILYECIYVENISAAILKLLSIWYIRL